MNDYNIEPFLNMLNDQHDSKDAILLIHADKDDVDAQDWAEMLLRMYIGWATMRGFNLDIVDQTPGDEVGLKSATIAISGEYAFGYLQSERGVHQLVRLSPFDSAHRRQVSRVLVQVRPAIADKIDNEIDSYTERGETIRSYMLYPFQVVRDLRTEHETSQTQQVLDGDLDAFMEAYLKCKTERQGE